MANENRSADANLYRIRHLNSGKQAILKRFDPLAKIEAGKMELYSTDIQVMQFVQAIVEIIGVKAAQKGDKLLELMGRLLQLEWIYAAEAQSSSELQTIGPIVAPPAEEMEVLHRLARLGNMQRIVEQANHLVQLDERYRPFANEVRSLAKNYESKALLKLVAQYLQSDSLLNRQE